MPIFSLESNSFVFDSFLIIVIVYIRILPPVRSTTTTTTTIPWTHCFKLYFIVKLIIEDEEEEQKPNSVLLLLGFFLVVPLRFLFIHSFSQSVSFFLLILHLSSGITSIEALSYTHQWTNNNLIQWEREREREWKSH